MTPYPVPTMKRRHPIAMIGALFVAAACGGCVQSLPFSELPPLSKDTKPVLTAEQQKAAVGDLATKSETKRSETIKAIETSAR